MLVHCHSIISIMLICKFPPYCKPFHPTHSHNLACRRKPRWAASTSSTSLPSRWTDRYCRWSCLKIRHHIANYFAKICTFYLNQSCKFYLDPVVIKSGVFCMSQILYSVPCLHKTKKLFLKVLFEILMIFFDFFCFF